MLKFSVIGWFFVGSICVNSVYGQTVDSRLDSIDEVLKQTDAEEKKVALMMEAAEMAESEDRPRCVEYTSVLLEHPIVKADSSLYMEALRIQGGANRWIGNYVRSIEELKLCYAYYRHHQDTSSWVFSADHLGSMHVFMGYNEAAQKYMNEVYELEKARGDTAAIAGATNGLAIFYSNINQNEKARDRYEEALVLYEAVDDTLGRGNVHANLGLLLIDMKEYDLAEYHLNQQGHLDSLLNTQWGLGFYFDFMGYLRRMQGRLDEAYQSHLTALSIREGLESHYNVSETRSSLCDILLEMERYPEAIEQANLILADKDLHNSLSHQQNAHETLARAYEAMGNYRLGLEQQKAYKLISDSILNEDILETVAEKDAKFDLAEQRNKVALLDTQNSAAAEVIAQKNKTIWIGAAALIIFGLLILGLYILVRKYLRQKMALSSALSAKELLLKEIHHRVKNNLQIVSSLLSLQSRSVSDAGVLQAINEGKSRVRSMALIHQNLYKGENLTGVAVKPYLEKLSAELLSTYKIESDEIELKLDIDPFSLDVDTLVPLGLIINELITNSLKYAFSQSETAEGTIAIALREEGNTLLLEVSDTGKGYDTKVNSESEGFGQKLITSLSRQLEANLEIESDSSGTLNRLTISKYKRTD
ncbi:hypothetical protein O3Q51_09305 [Cryomorphaceae bacterium 1068]|nr:hypothetical protein [Cryomorphaceae bacterium 1068]